MIVRTAWPNAPSDVDSFAFARASADVASLGNSSWYGPFTLRQAAKGEELDKPEFRTATGGPEEVLAYGLASGLNVVALRAFSLRGLEAEVRIAGQAGWVSAPTGLDVVTRFRAGRAPFAFVSNVDLQGLRASAVGPAQTTTFTDLEIPQDVKSFWNFPGWGEWMVRGSFTYVFTLEKALILEVHIAGKSDVNDLDMAVFRDVNGNGALDPEEYLVIDCQPVGPGLCLNGNLWNYNADGDADERVKWIAPPDGQYIVKVLGFDVPSGAGHFDMDIAVTLDTGKGYEIPEAPKPGEIVNGTGAGLAAFARVSLNMTWDFPPTTTDGPYGGAVLLGLPNAPGVIVVPVVVALDRSPPRIAGLKVNAFNGRLNEVDNRTTNDRTPQLVISFEDLERGQLDPNSAHLVLDGGDVTPITTVTIQLLSRGGKLGLWEGTLAATPPRLSEGPHVVEASIADRAGNVAVAAFTFVVDTTAPLLVIIGGLLQYTRADTFTVSGTTEADGAVNVRGIWYPVDVSRTFAIPVAVLNGTNALAVTAADWFDADAAGNPVAGNAVTVTLTVVRDLLSPEFARFVADPGGMTREHATVVSGTVRDALSDGERGGPETLLLTVNGASVPVRPDGTFRVVVALAAEGNNTITAIVHDPAGNEATRVTTVARDTTAPALTLTARPPSTVRDATVTVAGTTESDAFVSVNGVAVLSPGGRFSATISLNAGPNTIVVQSRDLVGNVAEVRLQVTLVGPVAVALLAGMFALGILLGAVLAFLLSQYGIKIPYLSRREGKEEPPRASELETLARPPQMESEEPETAERHRGR